MTITSVSPEELAEALAYLYGPGSDEQIGHAFRMVARGELNANDLLVARSPTLRGAIFASLLPGSVAVIWPPRGESNRVEDDLVQAALEHVTGAKAVQAFLPPEEAERAAPLVRSGFRKVTSLGQMARRSPAKGHNDNSRARCELIATCYSNCDPSRFHATVERAHNESLDCPELNCVLTPPEVLAGYQDAAPDLSSWWLAYDRDEPVGVLILNERDLMFLGVVPERRGQGIGRWLLELALQIVPDLRLSVDVRNVPAVQLYRSAGFEFVDAREVYFYFPNSARDPAVAKVFPNSAWSDR